MRFFTFYQMNFREFLNLFRAGREGQGKEFVAAKISVRPSKGMAEGGCGGNSARRAQPVPFGYFQTDTAETHQGRTGLTEHCEASAHIPTSSA